MLWPKKVAKGMGTVAFVTVSGMTGSVVGSCRRLIHIHGRVYLTFYGEEDALQVAQHETSNYIVIPPLTLGENKKSNLTPPSLSEIYKFDEMVQNAARKHPSKKLIFSSGSNLLIRVRTAFLIGCHLIVSHDLDFTSVYRAFDKMHPLFDAANPNNGTGSSVSSSLRAIFRTKEHNWIDFKETFDIGPGSPTSIAMDEYLHYARLVPSFLAIIAFLRFHYCISKIRIAFLRFLFILCETQPSEWIRFHNRARKSPHVFDPKLQHPLRKTMVRQGWQEALQFVLLRRAAVLPLCELDNTPGCGARGRRGL